VQTWLGLSATVQMLMLAGVLVSCRETPPPPIAEPTPKPAAFPVGAPSDDLDQLLKKMRRRLGAPKERIALRELRVSCVTSRAKLTTRNCGTWSGQVVYGTKKMTSVAMLSAQFQRTERSGVKVIGMTWMDGRITQQALPNLKSFPVANGPRCTFGQAINRATGFPANPPFSITYWAADPGKVGNWRLSRDEKFQNVADDC